MSNYILTADGKLYHCDTSDSELYHYGVPGMKWGKRKQRVSAPGGMRQRGSQASTSSTSSGAKSAQKEARKAKVKKAVKIGAAVVGTAVAAYGAYKLTKFVQKKRSQKAMAAAKRQAEALEEWRSYMAKEQEKRIASMPGVISRTHTLAGPGGVVDTYKYRR